MKKNPLLKFNLLIFMLLAFVVKGYSIPDHNINIETLYAAGFEKSNYPVVLEDSSGKEKSEERKNKRQKPAKRDKNMKGKVTFESFEANYQRAMRFYHKQQYLSAARLFEELYPLSFGTPFADTILFTFADCYFQNQDYELSAFHFKDYTRRFPGTERTEEAYFRCVDAIYNVSPYYSLDQFETKYAIEEINLFIQLYPRSKYVEQCNSMLDELREKLAQKDFEIVKLYYNTENYQAAQIAAKNFLKIYSYSKYAPETLYLLVRNNLKYAKKSVQAKQRERYLDCIAAYELLKNSYPESSFVEPAKAIADEAALIIDKSKK